MPSFHERIDRKGTPLPPLQSPTQFAPEQQFDEPVRVRAGAGQSVRSPCNGTCVLSPHDDTCFGCLRTKTEIADWMGASDEERARIVQRCGERRGAGQIDQNTGGQNTGDTKDAGYGE